ncbi:MAG: hypothetical protein ACRYHA_28620 [Janthinobacterium lividum]
MSIFFLHIPKTAGTSIVSIVEDNMSVVDVIKMKRIRNSYYNGYVDIDLIGGVEALAGHIPLSFSGLMRKPVRKVVFLRDPVGLVMSRFHHYKKTGDIPAATDLLEFMASPYSECLSNMQTKWLAGVEIGNLPNADDSADASADDSAGKQGYSPPVAASKADFSLARHRLSTFDVVGIFEALEESISAMCATLGFSRVAGEVRLNVGAYESVRDARLLDAIARNNAFDLALYNFGVTLFRDRQTRPVSRPPVDAGRAPPWAVLDMDDVVRHEGLHLREIWPDWNGVRWSSEAALIDLRCTLQQGDAYAYELMVLSVLSPADAGKLEMTLDGVALNYTLRVSAGVYFYSGTFVPETSMSHPRLALNAPFARRPSDDGTAQDQRMLGVAIKAFRIMPKGYFAIDFAERPNLSARI